VTIEHVAHEATVDPATVRRLFISKAGLLHAVWDRMQIEPWEALVERVGGIQSADERLHAYIVGLGALIADPLITLGIAEVAAHGLRDSVVRRKLAADYAIARDSTLEVTGIEPANEADRRRLHLLVSLIIAVIDGLGLQVAVDPDAVDRDAVFALLADMVRTERADSTGGADDGVA
jgi:AcrR family transcriptional regulator